MWASFVLRRVHTGNPFLSPKTPGEDANAACQPSEVFSQPPAGFDPLTASIAELAEYGFPPPPPGGDAGALAVWTTAVTDALNYGPPDPTCGTQTHTTIYTGIWAGHIVPNSDYSNANFNFGETEFIQPSVPPDSGYPSWTDAPDASFWVGLGDTDIIQAGCDSLATASQATYKCWTEDFPEAPAWEGPAPYPGDPMYIDVEYLGSNETYYFLENETTGDYRTFTNPTPYVGFRAANFVVERVNGHYLPLFGGGGTSVYGNYFGSSTHTWELSNTNNLYEMTSNCKSNGTLLSKPTGVSSGEFTQVWYDYSPFNNTCGSTT